MSNIDLGSVFPGDDVVPGAVMIYDQTIKVNGTAQGAFPWLQQIGKGRGGWYLTRSFEQLLPQTWKASRKIEDRWQHLQPGDRIEDYGFNAAEDFFIVDSISPPYSIVLKSNRYGCAFSWALLLHESKVQDQHQTIVHLRFRGQIQATGLKRWLVVRGGGFMDWLSTTPMLAGLKERIEEADKDR